MREYRYTGRFRERSEMPPVPGEARDPFERHGVRRPIPRDQRLSLDQAMALAAKLAKEADTTMIFTLFHATQVIDGIKTQTRRPRRSGDTRYGADPISQVRRNGRLVYAVGRIYAVQPGRGKAAICHIQILKIRLQRLADITDRESVAEGFNGRAGFFAGWRALYPHSDVDMNQMVWALTFRLVGPPASFLMQPD